ncbi:MAG: hypothetical protein IJ443_01460 [Firmicutes bacterium]|nr:hypothetical protein [Bacillota bacterium]
MKTGNLSENNPWYPWYGTVDYALSPRLLNWERMYGLTPEGISRVLLAIWPASFLLAGVAYLVITLIEKWKKEE